MGKYKTTYERYGLSAAMKYAGVSKAYMCRYAKAAGWKRPTADQVAANIVSHIINQ